MIQLKGRKRGLESPPQGVDRYPDMIQLRYRKKENRLKFTGYYQGWNRCEGCGQTLQKVGDALRHRSGAKTRHDLVLQKKAEKAERMVRGA